MYAHYREAHKIHVVLARQVATSPVGFVDAMRETGGVGFSVFKQKIILFVWESHGNHGKSKFDPLSAVVDENGAE